MGAQQQGTLARALGCFRRPGAVAPAGTTSAADEPGSPAAPPAAGGAAPPPRAPLPVDASRATGFGDLPPELLERVFAHLAAPDARRAQFAACGVSRAWRALGEALFFAAPWAASPGLIVHPAQLFALSPRAPPGSRSGLLKCHVRRERGRFWLYLGKDASAAGRGRFLLAAAGAGRGRTGIHLDAGCAGAPAALLASNFARTRHALALPLGVEVAAGGGGARAGAAATGTPAAPAAPRALATLCYRARVNGLMQPRRMDVSLPPAAAADALPRLLRRASSCDGSAAAGTAAGAGASAATPAAPPPPRRPFSLRAALGARRAAAVADDGVPAPPTPGAPPTPTRLRNKAPHWNEALRCWCLNFRGRVKLASVKNFQLVRAGDPAARVVLQFGRVGHDAFVLDFDPTALSAVQAFAAALTTFEGRVV
jgi:hypothetical protein